MGVFQDEARAVSTVKAFEGTPWDLKEVHSPFPNHEIMEGLDPKKSKVGYFTLVGGVIGFFAGISLSVFTSSQWNLIVSGKPVISLIPFLIVGFELTILFAVFGNIIGLLFQARLPEFRSLEHYDPRCSSDHFGILASCKEGEQDSLMDFFREKRGEVRLFE